MAQDPEVLKVQPSDNPGMSLVSVPLDGNNFLSWSRSVRIALGAKMKLSFINGKGDKPQETDESYEQWVSGLHGHFLDFKFDFQRYCGELYVHNHSQRIVGRVRNTVWTRQWSNGLST
ncbi:UNVERIFIED_CONTAM: hypothetical protein Sradi_3836300 [Sesamum radiatum]|uniref:Retrotransposon Copia-like N-terminal domain-containing protein n=1 Tax=Sesamum radiatum TaxID=300843 RepID=A0AAW2Q180_SESRA